MVYVFDIDGTICTNTNGNYLEAKPYAKRISVINKLYADNNTIVFHTARGMGRGKDPNLFLDLTKKQLEEWGVLYHFLQMGKPSGDFYIDDKGIKDEDFFSNQYRSQRVGLRKNNSK
jgi:hypothetical protein